MTMERDFSRDELDVLAGARRALAPSAQDAARVLHSARLAIASGAEGAAGVASAAKPMSSAMSAALLRKAVLSLVIAGASAWLGYRAGYVVGEGDARKQDTRVQARPAAAVELPAPSVIQPAGPGIEPPSQAPRGIVEAPGAARRRTKSTAAPVEPPIDAPLAPPQAHPSLDAEVKALRAIERALRSREPQRALDLLAQLDRDVVDGQMLEERAAAKAMARCEARAVGGTPDQTDVMQRVLEFSQQYPASVYFARVRQTCLATIDRDPATDSAPR